jgi:hypothetical protein
MSTQEDHRARFFKDYREAVTEEGVSEEGQRRLEHDLDLREFSTTLRLKRNSNQWEYRPVYSQRYPLH